MSRFTSHLFRLFLGLLAVSTFTAIPAVAIPVTYAPGVSVSPEAQSIVNYMATTSGQTRAFLHVDPILMKVAQARAVSMGTLGYFGDVAPGGYGPNYLVQQAGYVLPASYGDSTTANYLESIAAGEPNAGGTWNDWMNSSPHRTHLLGLSSFYSPQTSVGVGYVEVPGSTYTYYWVVVTAPPNLASTIAINTPANGATVSNAQVTLTGTASSGAATIASVQFRVENANGVGAYQTASGIANWSATATLAPGVNTIRVQSVDGSGTMLAQAIHTVTYVVPSTLTLTVVGNGTVTKGFLGASTRDVGLRYAITATPAVGWIFAGWSGASTSLSAGLSFVMVENAQLTATFAPNPFLTRTGAYSGLLTGADAGLLSLSVASNGAFTGRITVNGVAYALHGVLSPITGLATVSIPRSHNTPLVVNLTMDLAGTTGVTATVTDGANISTVAAAGAYNTSAGKFASAGQYTVSLPPAPDADPTLPQGNGYALLTINALGQTSLVGALADGTAFSVDGKFSTDNTLPVYAVLYHGQGDLTGTLTLTDNGVSDVSGTLHWSKPLIATSHVYPAAFATDLPAVGSKYVRPAHGVTVVEVATTSDNAMLSLGAGGLPQPVVQTATLETTNVIVLQAPALPNLRATVNATTGRFSGSFVHPVTHVSTSFHGVIYQKANAAYGYFIGAEVSGYTSFVAVQ
jgi:uncharacterized protein YkwD